MAATGTRGASVAQRRAAAGAAAGILPGLHPVAPPGTPPMCPPPPAGFALSPYTAVQGLIFFILIWIVSVNNLFGQLNGVKKASMAYISSSVEVENPVPWLVSKKIH